MDKDFIEQESVNVITNLIKRLCLLFVAGLLSIIVISVTPNVSFLATVCVVTTLMGIASSIPVEKEQTE